MKSYARMIVTATELLDDDDGRDAGLVLVTAEAVRDDAVCSVTYLGNMSDGWCIGQEVQTIVWWKSDDATEDDLDHVLDRGFVADDLNPSDFTDKSVGEAKFSEDEF